MPLFLSFYAFHKKKKENSHAELLMNCQAKMVVSHARFPKGFICFNNYKFICIY